MKIQTVEFPDVEPLESGELDNDDRAEMVLPLVLAFRRAYYYHVMPGETEPSEPLETVIVDLIGDLLHLADRTPIEADPDDNLGADDAIDRARTFYFEEIEMERLEMEDA